MHEVVLLRHEQSIWNKDNRFTGRIEVSLSDKAVAATNQGKVRWYR